MNCSVWTCEVCLSGGRSVSSSAGEWRGIPARPLWRAGEPCSVLEAAMSNVSARCGPNVARAIRFTKPDPGSDQTLALTRTSSTIIPLHPTESCTKRTAALSPKFTLFATRPFRFQVPKTAKAGDAWGWEVLRRKTWKRHANGDPIVPPTTTQFSGGPEVSRMSSFANAGEFSTLRSCQDLPSAVPPRNAVHSPIQFSSAAATDIPFCRGYSRLHEYQAQKQSLSSLPGAHVGSSSCGWRSLCPDHKEVTTHHIAVTPALCNPTITGLPREQHVPRFWFQLRYPAAISLV